MTDSHTSQLILAGALAVDLILGEYPDKFHPVVWMGNYIRFLWEKRPSGRERDLFVWGIFIVLSGGMIFYAIPQIPERMFPRAIYLIFALFLLKPAFAARALLEAAQEIFKNLDAGDLNGARELTSRHLVSRNTEELSEAEVCGAVIESVAENLTDSFVSPLFYFSMAGIPGAWAYRFFNTCDSMIAYRKGDFEKGGKFAARLDDILNWIPARLGSLLILGASAVLGEDWKRGWKVLLSEKSRTASPNAGWTMSAMAGVLGVTLEKRGEYTLEGGKSLPDFQLIPRALKIVITAMAFNVIIVMAFLEVFL